MKRRLMEILACPIDKYHPLRLYIFDEKDEVVEGMMVCPKCLRWYPIRDEIPELLPDELRDEKDEVSFLEKWKDKIPEEVLLDGKPYNLRSRRQGIAQ
ncbi:MAG: Trm112 family protein [Candidatus Bathyarchaeia archaeon]